MEYLSLMEEYSTNNRFSVKTIVDLKKLGLLVLTTNNMGIVEGIKHYSKEGKAVTDKVARGFGTVLKDGTYAVGFTYGMYNDLSNNDKTVGEAVAHNGTSFAWAVGTGVVLSAVGAPVVAGLAIGAVVGYGFDLAYNHNWGEFQDKLDKVGEAVSSDFIKLNTVNWAWW